MQSRKVFRLPFLILPLVLVIFWSSLTVLAADSSNTSLPQPSEQFYVQDEAQVLSEATVQAILTKNESLHSQYGVQLVVHTVSSLQGGDIQSYASAVYKAWGIGGKEEKGLLLVLDIAGDTYFTVAGAGLRENMTSTALQAMLNQNLEPDFAAKNYDAGVAKFFNAAAQRAELFASSQKEPAPTDPTSEPFPETAPSGETKKETAPSALPNGMYIFALVLAGGIAVFAIVTFVYNRTRPGYHK